MTRFSRSATQSSDNEEDATECSSTPSFTDLYKRVWSHSTVSTIQFPSKYTAFVSTFANQYLPGQPAACHQSAGSSKAFLINEPTTRPAKCPSSLPLSGSSADSTVWDPEGDTSRPEQLTSSPASTPTNRLTNWLTDWGGGWMTDYHSAGGRRIKAPPLTDQLTRCLAGGMDGWLVYWLCLAACLGASLADCFCLTNCPNE